MGSRGDRRRQTARLMSEFSDFLSAGTACVIDSRGHPMAAIVRILAHLNAGLLLTQIQPNPATPGASTRTFTQSQLCNDGHHHRRTRRVMH
jgi:hypothetical protein